ncbi:MAG: glycosyltransferase family 87 protein, partial [Phototrophicaceae bacterium]
MQQTSWSKVIILGGLSSIIFVLMVIATHNFLTEPFPGHNDFLSRWEGARSFWVDGLNPYGEEASLNIQTMMWGRPSLPDEDQVLFAYPMYTAILIAPLVWVNYAWASAIMMVIMEAMMLIALFMLFDLFDWRPKVGTLALLALIALFHYAPSRGLILGQLGLVSYFMYVVTFWGLKREQDWVAGVALSIATIKPQLGFLIVPFLLLWGLRVKRWHFVGSFTISLGILVGASFLLVPTWLFDMWQQVTAYTGYAPPIPSDVLFGEVLGISTDFKYILFAALWLMMLIGWYQVLVQNRQERAMWVAMITLAVSNIASPVIAIPHFAVFMIPLIFYLKHLSRRPKNRKWALVLLLVVMIEPWIRFFLTLDYETTLESWVMAYPEPIVVLLSLWFTRQLWWEKGNLLQPVNHQKTAITR